MNDLLIFLSSASRHHTYCVCDKQFPDQSSTSVARDSTKHVFVSNVHGVLKALTR